MLVLKNAMYNLYTGQLLAYDEAYQIHAALLRSAEMPTPAAYRPSLLLHSPSKGRTQEWSRDEVRLLQWVILCYIDQHSKLPSELVVFSC